MAIEDLNMMYEEARQTILQYGYENVSLELIGGVPGLSHKDFSRTGQDNIAKEISLHRDVENYD